MATRLPSDLFSPPGFSPRLTGPLPPNCLFVFFVVSLINIASLSVIFFAELASPLAAGGAVAEPDCNRIPTIDTSRKKFIETGRRGESSWPLGGSN